MPHENDSPRAIPANVCPPDTGNGVDRLARKPLPSWPELPTPQQNASPSSLMAQECESPALTRTTPSCTGGSTVSVELPLAEPAVAVMIVMPSEMAVATPDWSTVATVSSELLQTTSAIMGLPLTSRTVATYGCVPPGCSVTPSGATSTLPMTGVGASTITVAVPLTRCDVAVMIAVPSPTAVAMPSWSTIATSSSELLQITSALMGFPCR